MLQEEARILNVIKKMNKGSEDMLEFLHRNSPGRLHFNVPRRSGTTTTIKQFAREYNKSNTVYLLCKGQRHYDDTVTAIPNKHIVPVDDSLKDVVIDPNALFIGDDWVHCHKPASLSRILKDVHTCIFVTNEEPPDDLPRVDKTFKI